MDEAKTESGSGVDLKTGGIGAAAGAVAMAIVMALSGKEMDNATVQAVIDTLAVQGKVCELAEVTDKLALTTDSIKPAYRKPYLTVDPKDTTGKTYIHDTVTIPAAPVLTGFDENGKADYELANIVPAGSTLRITYILDGKEVNSQLIQPKAADWLISARCRASLYTGK